MQRPGGDGYAVMVGQQEMEADIDRVSRWGKEHPEVWGGAWMDGVRVVVAVLDAERHAPALRQGLEHPDRVDVVVAPRTAREVERARRRVDGRARRSDSFQSFGVRVNTGPSTSTSSPTRRTSPPRWSRSSATSSA